jgi:hypothetical protein
LGVVVQQKAMRLDWAWWYKQKNQCDWIGRGGTNRKINAFGLGVVVKTEIAP